MTISWSNCLLAAADVPSAKDLPWRPTGVGTTATVCAARDRRRRLRQQDGRAWAARFYRAVPAARCVSPSRLGSARWPRVHTSTRGERRFTSRQMRSAFIAYTTDWSEDWRVPCQTFDRRKIYAFPTSRKRRLLNWIFGPGRRVPKSHSSCSSCCWNQFSRVQKSLRLS